MEDLGDPEEIQIDYFRFVEQTHVSQPSPPPSTPHASLLAASSRYGILFTAAKSAIVVKPLASLRPDAKHSTEPVLVSLDAQHIRSIALVLDDTSLLVHYVNHDRHVLDMFDVRGLHDGEQTWCGGVRVKSSPIQHVAAVADTVIVLYEDNHVDVARIIRGQLVNGQRMQPLSEGHPVCVALESAAELLAVGCSAGNVFLLDVDTLEQKANIPVVLSGWIPFGVAFVAPNDIMVSYTNNGNFSHVVWEIADGEQGITVGNRSIMGELCYAMLPLPDEDEEEQVQPQSLIPVMYTCPIPEWGICVVGSSLSADLKTISKNDQGTWEVWQFDEGKAPILPMDDNDCDSMPLGLALDLTNLQKIDSIDPSSPQINPMPILLTMVTGGVIIPFTVIDGRKGAVCENIEQPQPLPEKETFTKPKEDPSEGGKLQKEEQKEPNLFNTNGLAQGFKSLYPTNMGGALTTGSTATSNLFGFGGSFNQEGTNIGGDGTSFMPAFSQEMQSRRDDDDDDSFTDENDEDDENSENEGSYEQESDDDDNQSTTACKEPEHHQTTVNQTAKASIGQGSQKILFSGTDKFLANFQFPDTSNDPNFEHDSYSRDLSRPKAFEPASSSNAMSKSGAGSPSIVLPPYPLQPSYEEVSSIASTGKPEDLIRSILLEMSQELDFNREVARVMTERIENTKGGIIPQVTSTKKSLNDYLHDMRNYFKQETNFRREVLGALKEMMSRSREYESMSLEFRVREDESFSRDIRPEDKLIDEQITNKEMEVLKALTAIESRIEAERASRDRQSSQVERIQQIYSSLSLQGIRIKRIRGLLTALSARLDQMEKGGRSSDLGLSMARLEKLSIRESPNLRSPQPAGYLGSRTAVSQKSGIDALSGQGKLSTDGNEESSTMSKEVLTVLRRLAMCGGRQSITAVPTKARFQSSKTTSRVHDISGGNLSSSGNAIYSKENAAGNFFGSASEHEFKAENTFGRPSKEWNVGNGKMISEREQPQALGAYSTIKTSSEIVDSKGTVALRQTDDSTLPPPSAFSNYSRFSGRKRSEASTAEVTSNAFESTANATSSFGESSFALKQEPTQRVLFKSPLSGNKNLTVSNQTSFLDSSKSPIVSQKLPKEEPKEISSSKPSKHPSLFTALPPTEKPQPANHQESKVPQLKDREGADTFGKSSGIESSTRNLKDRTGEVPFAALPPAKEEKENTFAHLPPDDDAPGAQRPPLPGKKVKNPGTFAALPPDESVSPPNKGISYKKENPIPVASLPPDDDDEPSAPASKKENNGLFASLPPDDDDSTSAGFPSKSKDSGKTGGLFAALPPDDDGKALSSGFEGSLSFQNKTDASKPAPADDIKTKEDVAKDTDAKKNGFESKSTFGESKGAFGFGGSAGGSFGMTSSVFGLGNANNAATTSATTLSLFGQSTAQQESNKNTGMDTSSGSQIEQKGFTAFASQASSSQQGTTGIFGSGMGQETNSSTGFGAAMSSGFGAANTQSNAFGGGMTDASQGGIFGSSGTKSNTTFPFGSGGNASTGFGNSGSGFGQSTSNAFGSPASGFGASGGSSFGASFGSSSQLGQGNQSASGMGNSGFGTGGAQFGMNSPFGATAQFGSASPIGGASFGAQSQLGGGSPFNSNGAGSGFGSATPFGSGAQAPTFGSVSNMGQSGGFGQSSFGSGKPSPFTMATGTAFGGQSGGNPSFAALAASQGGGFGAAGGSGFGSGFGNSGPPVFGSNTGPPSFTSAAFSERRG